jgi:glycopeptide antibiotics resistance protein
MQFNVLLDGELVTERTVNVYHLTCAPRQPTASMIPFRRPINERKSLTTGAIQARFVILAILYGLIILYSSLILGPDGLHYVAIGPAAAWDRFRAIAYVSNASDQRPDWIANMLMTIPLAFLASGALAWRRRPLGEAGAAALAVFICVAFILAVKYAQIFFPPRTVTLNYIVAQSIGALLGTGLFGFARRRAFPTLVRMHRDSEELVIVLGAYTLLLTAYVLMPFDLALSPDDLATRLSQLPLALAPGAGHDPAYRAFLILADAVSMVPVGMFLAVTGHELSFKSLVLRGIGMIVPVTILTLFVLSATPFALSLVTRTAGVAVGIWFMWKLKGKDLWKRHYRYARYVPIALPLYVVLIIFASGLLTTGWQSMDRAWAALEPRQLLPLWSFYMLSKVDAAQNFVATFFLFAPIGAMIWLRRGFWSRGAGLSAFIAGSLSLSIEVGRMMKPGLVPDFTDPFIAAIAAAAASRAMPALWKMFEHEAKISVHRDSHVAQLERAAQIFNLAEPGPWSGETATGREESWLRRRHS